MSYGMSYPVTTTQSTQSTAWPTTQPTQPPPTSGGGGQQQPVQPVDPYAKVWSYLDQLAGNLPQITLLYDISIYPQYTDW
jgi:hypothetical protein